MLDSVKIGRRLQLLRDSLGMSQVDFAKGSGLSQAAISQIESGLRLPSMKTLQRLSNSFGINLTDLVSESKDGSDKQILINMIVAELNKVTIDDLKVILPVTQMLSRKYAAKDM